MRGAVIEKFQLASQGFDLQIDIIIDDQAIGFELPVKCQMCVSAFFNVR